MRKSNKKYISLAAISMIIANTVLNNIIFVPIVDAFDSTFFGTTTQSNVAAVSQTDKIDINKQISTGENVSININGQLYSQAFDTSSEVTFQLLSTQINFSTGVSSQYSTTGNSIILSSKIPGNYFTAGNLIINSGVKSPVNLVQNIVATAQQSQVRVPQSLFSGDLISMTIGGHVISQTFTGNKSQTLAAFVGSVTENTDIEGNISGNDTIVLTSKNPGTAFGYSDLIIESNGIPFSNIHSSISPISQTNSIKIARPVYADETINITVNGSPVSQTFSTDSNTTITNFVNQINNISGVSASLSGDEIIVQASQAGTPFLSSDLTINGGTISSTNISPNIGPQSQIESITLPRNLSTGDTLHLSINNSLIQTDFTNSNEQTLDIVRGAVNGISNLNTSIVTGSNTIIITSTSSGTPFTVGGAYISTSFNSTNIVANNIGQKHMVSVTVPRTMVNGDRLSLIVNGNTIVQNFTGDSSTTIENLNEQIDSISNISSVYSNNKITVTSDITGNALVIGNLNLMNMLTPEVLIPNTEPVAQKNTFSIPSVLLPGDTINLTLNSNTISQAFDNDETQTSNGLNTQLNGIPGILSAVSGNNFEIEAATPGSGFDISDILTQGNIFTGITSTENTPELKAKLEITVGSIPLSGDIISIGECNISFGSGDSELDCSDGNAFINNEGVSVQDINDSLNALTGTEDENNGTLQAVGSGSNIIFEKSGTQDTLTGIYFSGIDSITGTANTPAVAVAQVSEIELPREFLPGDNFTLYLNNTPITQTFLSDSTTSITNLITQINAVPNISASLSGIKSIYIESSLTGIPFELGTGQFLNTQSSMQTIAADLGTAQQEIITFPFSFISGDTIGVNINSTPISQTFQTDSITTLNSLAQNITGSLSNILSYTSGTNGLVIQSAITGTSFTIGNIEISNDITPFEEQSNQSGTSQIDEIIIPSDLLSGDNLRVNINGNIILQQFDTDSSTTLSGLVGQINNVTGINAAISGTNTIIINSTVPGTPFTAGLINTGAEISSVNVQPNIESGFQTDSIAVDRNIVSGDIISFDINGNTLLQAFTEDKISTLSGLTTQINGIAGLSGSFDGDLTITIQSATPGIGFSGGILSIIHTSPSLNLQANVEAVAQQYIISLQRSLIEGDRISLNINGTDLSQEFTGDESSTLNLLKTKTDEMSGGSILTISGADLVFTAKTAGIPFTLSSTNITNTISPVDTQNNISAVSQVESIEIPVFMSGDHYGFTINSTQISGDFITDTQQTTNSILASVNTTTGVNGVLSGQQMIITSSVPGTPFTVSDLSVTNTSVPYNITGNIQPVAQIVEFTATNIETGLTYRLTVNGINYDYVSISGDSVQDVMNGLYSSINNSSTGAVASIGTDKLILTATNPGISFDFQTNILDNTPPVITFPTNIQQILRGGVTSSSTVSINENGSIYFMLSGTSISSTGDIEAAVSSSSGFVGVLNASGNNAYTITPGYLLKDGNYFAVGVDAYGNISAPVSSWLTIDNTAPNLTVLTGTHYTNQNNVNITGTTEANISVTVSGGNGIFTGISQSDGIFSIPVTLNTNILNNLYITVEDEAGNISTGNIIFINDNITPPLNLLTGIDYTNSTGWTFTGATKALSTVRITDISGNNITGLQSDISGNFEITVPLSLNMLNTFMIEVTDNAGNTTTGEVSIIQDSTIPSILFNDYPSITSGNNIIISGTTKNDSIVNVQNGTGNYSTTSTLTGYFELNIGLDINTGNNIEFTVHDKAGNSGTGLITIIQDSIVNSLIIGTPNQFTNQSSIVLSGSTKPNSAIRIDGGLIGVLGTADSVGIFSITVGLNQNTANILTVSSTDNVGNISTGSITVTHDNIQPTVNISTLSGTTYNTTIVINGTTQGNSQISISGGVQTAYGVSDMTGNYSVTVSLNTGSVNSLIVTVTDQAGNIGTGNIQITHDNVMIFLNISLQNRYTNMTGFTFTGNTKAGASLYITGGVSEVNTTADSNGNFTGNIILNTNTSNNIFVTAQDNAGGSASTGFTVIHDNILPSLTLNPYNNITNLNTVNISGNTKSGSNINILSNGNTFTGTAGNTGFFNMSIPLTQNTLNLLNITITDQAGNISTGSASILHDNISPVLSNISVSPRITENNLTVNYSFTTNEESSSVLYIGTGINVNSTVIAQSTTTGTNHIGTLLGLNANTNYYYIIQSQDNVGNTSSSQIGTVSLTSVADPVISNMTADEITSNGAKISFNFNDSNFLSNSATGSLTVGNMTILPIITKTSGYNTGYAYITGLTQNTSYSYTLTITNDYGKSSSQTGSFQTINSVNLGGGTENYSGGAQLPVTNSGFQTLNGTNIIISSSSGSLNISGNIAILYTSGWDGIIQGPVYVSPSSDKSGTIGKLSSLISSMNSSEFTYTGTVVGTIKAGSDIFPLIASGGNFILQTNISQTASGQTLYIYRSNDGIIWEVNTPENTCTINSNNQCTFHTNHLTYFSFVAVTRTSTGNGGNNNGGGGGNNTPATISIGGGGGGSINRVRDNCPYGDKSLSYYDGKCDAELLVITNTGTQIVSGTTDTTIINTNTGTAVTTGNSNTDIIKSNNRGEYKASSGKTYIIVKNSDGSYIYKNSKAFLSPKFKTLDEIKNYLDTTSSSKIELNIDYTNPWNKTSGPIPTKIIKVILFQNAKGKNIVINKLSNGKYVYINDKGVQSKEFNSEKEIFKYLEKNS